MNKTESTEFVTSPSTKKHGFIQIRSVSYNKFPPMKDPDIFGSFDPVTHERNNMKTQYHWVKKPPFATRNLEKFRSSYQTFYSGFKHKSIDIKSMNKSNQPLVLPANKTSGRDLAKTFGYNTDGCFKNIPHWKSESTKFIKKKNIMDLETRERDPYFLNFIRDEIIDDMPDYKSQKDTCMPKHYETVKSQTVLTEQQFRTSFKFNMEEKPENYENDRVHIGV